MPGTPSSVLSSFCFDECHDECIFCKKLFVDQGEMQIKLTKKKIVRFLKAPEVDKEEEFFRMMLLTFQMKYRTNQKVLKLDHRTMYKQVQNDG